MYSGGQAYRYRVTTSFHLAPAGPGAYPGREGVSLSCRDDDPLPRTGGPLLRNAGLPGRNGGRYRRISRPDATEDLPARLSFLRPLLHHNLAQISSPWPYGTT